jgi:hypothetical protein
MGLQLEDGTGNGYQAGITYENKLRTSATTFTLEHEINHHDGQAYSLHANVTPTGAGSCFLYLRNNSDKDIVISGSILHATTDEIIIFKLGDSGTPIGGNSELPVNRNAGSGNEADATSLTGVDITGLAGGKEAIDIFIAGGQSSYHLRPDSNLILPRNKVFSAYVVNGGIGIRVGIGFVFHSIEV